MLRQRSFLSLTLVFLLTLAVLSTMGCGQDKQKMQAFVDGYLQVMETLQSKPEVTQAGQEAYTKYASSGYSDLESAEKAKVSYEESSKNDQAALKDLEKLAAPDEKASEIKQQMSLGVVKVDKGNKMFAGKLARAKDQTVEQRAAETENISAPMGLYVEGITEIVASLANLQEYVKSNGLQAEGEVKKWYDQIKGELDLVKQYAPK
jgi:hypothetical protein